ncbi:MAG TPA: hypothetical protein PLF79_13650 [Thauera sp.]|uniref:hypothetical protein n=1 Tax=Thauera sp. TaxID=1905334 RepID=UPI002C29E516|nr:hypothetical protein [Thauera sp.]HRP26237.1 hypothetical protein [Thauera sp.]HRP67119.1 hypothetical protein [Thauera sp.]
MTRAALTAVWVASFLAAVLVVESYFIRTTVNGIPFLLPADRVTVYTLIGAIYGANVGAALACWFIKPFPLPKSVAFERFVNRLAVVLTVAYNLILLYLLGQGHLDQSEPIDTLLERVKIIGGLLAFLAMPINAYYFSTARSD